MKKYRLIKEYPGSPRLGTTVKRIDNSTMYKTIEDIGYPFLSITIENQPEFWEEIVEKDYEILEYKTESGLTLKAPFLEDSEHFYINQRCKIHSIKRLSDGEIFTIGDKVNHPLFSGNGIIKSFRTNTINNNLMRIKVNFIKKYEDSDDSVCFLKHLSKIKQPLFTTEQRSEIEEIIKNIIK
jgi:hypothetical protein